jgi:uncharacterized phage-associated protein
MLRLMKLLYIAERECLAQHRIPITSDQPFAMKQGPILSKTHDLLRSRGDDKDQPEWDKFIQVDGTEAYLQADPGHGKLCRAIREKIEEVYNRYKKTEDEDLIEETHTFNEWINNWEGEKKGAKGSVEFSWDDAMSAQGVSAENILQARNNQILKEKLDQLVAR